MAPCTRVIFQMQLSWSTNLIPHQVLLFWNYVSHLIPTGAQFQRAFSKLLISPAEEKKHCKRRSQQATKEHYSLAPS